MPRRTVLFFVVFTVVLACLGVVAANSEAAIPVRIFCGIGAVVWIVAGIEVTKRLAEIDGREAARQKRQDDALKEFNERLKSPLWNRLFELSVLSVGMSDEEFNLLYGEEFAKLTNELSESLRSASSKLKEEASRTD